MKPSYSRPGSPLTTVSPYSLKKLSLSNTGLTDSGLPPLRSLRDLQELCLDRTAISSGGVAALITCLPHLQVNTGPCSVGGVQLWVDPRTVHHPKNPCVCVFSPQVLGLACTRVGDSVVRRGLIGCSQLLKLNLSRTRITDRGMATPPSTHPAHAERSIY